MNTGRTDREPRTTPTPEADEPAGAVLRRLVLPIYIPALLVQGGVGMLVPVLPLYLEQEGLSFTMIGLILAAAGLGSTISQLPVGSVLGRVAERTVMLAALVVMAVSTVVLGFTGVAITLAVLRFVSGIGSTGWLLSRQTFMTRAAPAKVRGRAMSIFGGTQRAGIFLGGLAGGFLAEWFGFAWAFVAVTLVTLAAVVPLVIDRHPLSAQTPTAERPAGGLFGAFRHHRSLLLLAGSGQVAIIAVRTGRLVVLPLVGSALGLSPSEVGVLVSIGSFADLALFPLAGFIMDRFGRLFAIVPAFCGIGVGMFLLAAADGYAGVAVAATIIGLANGIGSGTMLTQASDLAPRESPSQFLASLGTLRDSGKIAAPLLVGWLADVAGLPTASVVLGLLAFVATAVLVFGIGETRDRTPTRSPT